MSEQKCELCGLPMKSVVHQDCVDENGRRFGRNVVQKHITRSPSCHMFRMRNEIKDKDKRIAELERKLVVHRSADGAIADSNRIAELKGRLDDALYSWSKDVNRIAELEAKVEELNAETIRLENFDIQDRDKTIAELERALAVERACWKAYSEAMRGNCDKETCVAFEVCENLDEVICGELIRSAVEARMKDGE